MPWLDVARHEGNVCRRLLSGNRSEVDELGGNLTRVHPGLLQDKLEGKDLPTHARGVGALSYLRV